jgi:hypothetical protein
MLRAPKKASQTRRKQRKKSPLSKTKRSPHLETLPRTLPRKSLPKQIPQRRRVMKRRKYT